MELSKRDCCASFVLYPRISQLYYLIKRRDGGGSAWTGKEGSGSERIIVTSLSIWQGNRAGNPE